jgi:hypothetical protein
VACCCGDGDNDETSDPVRVMNFLNMWKNKHLLPGKTQYNVELVCWLCIPYLLS